jgi:hypothetical protein
MSLNSDITNMNKANNQLNSLNIIKSPQCMTLEIHVLEWYMHK